MEDKQKDKEDKYSLLYPLSLVAQIGVTVSVTVLVFISIGKFLDGYFNVSPIFVIMGGIIALVASMYGVYLLILPVIEEGKKEEKK